MRSLTQWSPREELQELERRISSLFHKEPLSQREDQETLKVVEWAPSVDVTEDEKEYLIQADAPGVNRDDIKVAVENGVLTVSGERRSEKEEKGKKFHKVERTYGSFARSFSLPEEVEEDKLSAKFSGGVLTVHLPKAAKAKTKTQEIKVS